MWIVLALLTGCEPYADVVSEEAAWWDAARIEEDLGIDLVEIEDGDPIGYWPRVVIEDDWIGFDNRAWFLSLPPELFQELPPEEMETLLISPNRLVPLQDGRLEGVSFDPIEPLDEVFSDALQARERANTLLPVEPVMEDDPPGDRRDEVRPHLTVIPEPGIPQETLFRVLFQAYTSGFEEVAIAGRVGPHLRHPGATQFRECGWQAGLLSTDGHAWTVLDSELPPLSVRAEATATPIDVAGALDELASTCASAWDQADREACVGVNLSLVDGETVDPFLATQAALYGSDTLDARFLTRSTDLQVPELVYAIDDLTEAQRAFLCDQLTARGAAAPALFTGSEERASLAEVFPEFAKTLPPPVGIEVRDDQLSHDLQKILESEGHIGGVQ